MKIATSRAATLVLALFLLPAGMAHAGDANVTASGDVMLSDDANQGSGIQTNADNWEDMGNALAGSGSQTTDTGGSANTGSGAQDSSMTSSDDWYEIYNANTGSGAQVLDSDNSNGGDRNSNDLVFGAQEDAVVANSALEASVSGNSVAVTGTGLAADSTLTITDWSEFYGLSGVNAIAIGSGDSASQNVGVNVTAEVSGS